MNEINEMPHIHVKEYLGRAIKMKGSTPTCYNLYGP